MSQRIAVVGSGPSGFYAIQALFKKDPDVRCDLYDRLPTPYGLVRGGVAPDHQKIKSVVKAYQKVAAEDRFRFFGNVELGRHVTIDDLLARYDQVVLAVGAQSNRKLGIPGEDLPGVFSATEFVAWYNGHPDFQHMEFPLDVSDVAVIGVGNVAMDVSRVLACHDAHLRPTDITREACEQLARHVRARVHVLGRRGPAQAAFTPKEIQEIAALDGIDVRTRDDEAELDPLSAAWLETEGGRDAHANVEFVKSRTGPRDTPARTEMWLRFLVSPVEFLGDGRVEAVKVQRTRIVDRGNGWLACDGTGETEVIPCGLALTAVGYRSVPLPGVPFDDRRGVIPNHGGQVVTIHDATPVDDLFVVGWAKRGPTGLIGTNRADSLATVETMLATGVKSPAQGGDPEEWLSEVAPEHVTWADWERLDAMEIERGAEVGKVREKFTAIDDMLAALRG